MGAHAPVDLPSHPELSRLAREDPDAYERLRTELIEGLIAGAPDSMQARLRGLQFRIDGVRRLAKSPLGATLRVYSMMWDSLTRLNEEIHGLSDWQPVEPPEASARVVEFRPRTRALIAPCE